MSAPELEPEAELVTDNRFRWLSWLLACEPCPAADCGGSSLLELDLGCVPGSDVTLVFGLCEECGRVRGVFTGEVPKCW